MWQAASGYILPPLTLSRWLACHYIRLYLVFVCLPVSLTRPPPLGSFSIFRPLACSSDCSLARSLAHLPSALSQMHTLGTPGSRGPSAASPSAPKFAVSFTSHPTRSIHTTPLSLAKWCCRSWWLPVASRVKFSIQKWREWPPTFTQLCLWQRTDHGRPCTGRSLRICCTSIADQQALRPHSHRRQCVHAPLHHRRPPMCVSTYSLATMSCAPVMR